MLVPTSRSSLMAREFQPLDNLAALPNEYTQDTSAQQTIGTVSLTPRYPYGYLLNFFFGSKSSDPAGTAPNFAQMLEYLQVPSPFVGTETVLDPVKFAFNTHIQPAPNGIGGPVAGESSMVQGGQEPDGTAGLHPPFNTVSNYRDPGKVNINTIADPSAGAVWNAIGGNVEYVEHDSRRPGVRRCRGQPPRLRQRGGAVPLRRQASVDLFQSVPCARRRRYGAADRSERQHRFAAKAGECQHLAGQPGRLPIAAMRAAICHEPDHAARTTITRRNPYFYFETMGRVTNKITTRSNVYAVWITVGYFEVTPWQGTNANGPMVIDAGHPDGYQLGQELGSDTGDVERHRGFYIIDRSIPVGFQRGVDNNVNNAVILKRFIE